MLKLPALAHVILGAKPDQSCAIAPTDIRSAYGCGWPCDAQRYAAHP
jgi:hypothetical protein